MDNDKRLEKECLYYFSKNPFSYETIESLAVRVGRDSEILIPIIDDLVSKKVLAVIDGEKPIFYLEGSTANNNNTLSTSAENENVTRMKYTKEEEFFTLTKREKEVLKLVVDGRSNSEIANSLYISEHTVKNHVTNIFKKVNVTDRLELLSMLYRLNIKFN